MQSSTYFLYYHADLLKEYNVELKGPFNYSARDEAGIPRDWYDDASSTSIKDKKDKDGNQEQLSAVYKRLAVQSFAMEKREFKFDQAT
ncbi:hypothetical protein GYH30_037733 [Glycine max]|nr:hypothetical protein GYH30_037733 [Glycine max]